MAKENKTTANVYFQAAMYAFERSNEIQPNSVQISTVNTYNYSSDVHTRPKIIEERHVENRFVIPHDQHRQVMLVEIHNENIAQQPDKRGWNGEWVKGEKVSRTNQHFNLLILDGKTAYLFEPLKKQNTDILKTVSSQFPRYHVVSLENVHPQTSQKKDKFCMVYVCMLAAAVLKEENNGKAIVDIAEETFANQTTESFLMKLPKQLPPRPEGQQFEVRSHLDDGNVGSHLVPKFGKGSVDWLGTKTVLPG